MRRVKRVWHVQPLAPSVEVPVVDSVHALDASARGEQVAGVEHRQVDVGVVVADLGRAGAASGTGLWEQRHNNYIRMPYGGKKA